MKRILITLLLLIVSATAVAAQETMWKRYTVKGEEFSVNLPALPALTTDHQPKTPESRETWSRRLGVYADGVVYTIYSLDDGNPRKAMKNGIDGVSGHLRWDANSMQDVTHDNFAGKQFFAIHSLGGTVQVFATDKHYYRFQAVGAPASDPRVQQFFSSLLLGPDLEGIEVTDGPGIPWEPPSGSVNEAQIYTSNLVDRKALLIMKLEPSYTDEARNSKTTGTVVLRAVFSARGTVTDIVTMSALPDGLTERAIESVKKIKFIPAVKDGKYVSTPMQFEFNFALY